MGLIALLIAGISAFLLWDSPHYIMKWVVLASGGVAWYTRRVVASLQKRGGFRREEVHQFWQHTAVVCFWASIILSLVGVYIAVA